ncbi:MAG: hypothetical protein HEQ25_01655 [Dolichospermum sp. DET73]|nr:hypothetical protein [Dolichospermum sp. DET73]
MTTEEKIIDDIIQADTYSSKNKFKIKDAKFLYKNSVVYDLVRLFLICFKMIFDRWQLGFIY